MVRALYVVMLCCVPVIANAVALQDPDHQDFVNLVQRARTEYRSGNFAAAQAAFEDALQLLPRSEAIKRAATLAELADVYMNEDELSRAERAYSESITIYRRLSDQKNTALVLRNLGALYSMQRRDDDALRVLKQALKLIKGNSDVNPVLQAQLLNSFGVVYCRQGRFSKAESYFTQAMQTASLSKAPYPMAELLHNLGVVYYEDHQFGKAEDFLKQSLRITEREVGPSHPDLTFTLASLGFLYSDSGKFAEAEEQYRRALAILDPGKLVFDTRIARLLQGLSVTYARAGRKAEADAALAQAAVIARRNLSEHPDMVAIVEAYSATLKQQGKTREAEELRVEARRARVTSGLVINALSPF